MEEDLGGKKIMLSTIIIAKNEQEKIKDCLNSVNFSDEVILIDSGSTDNTIRKAKQNDAKVYISKSEGYSAWRNEGLKRAKGDWILYIDADERVSNGLRDEIIKVISKKENDYSYFAIPRENHILGVVMKHGGWWPDHVIRLFDKKYIKKWEGELHEQPKVEGKMGYLNNPLIHLKHDNLSDMMEKTNRWSEIEAKLLFDAGHPKMVWWRFIRVMLTEAWLRLVKKAAFLDGPKGIIYALYLSWSKFVTYAKLWEMQLQSQNLKIKNQNESGKDQNPKN